MSEKDLAQVNDLEIEPLTDSDLESAAGGTDAIGETAFSGRSDGTSTCPTTSGCPSTSGCPASSA